MSVKNKNNKIIILIIICVVFIGIIIFNKDGIKNWYNEIFSQESYIITNIPEYDGKYSALINDNKPSFSESDLTSVSFEKYSNLDSLGRCGVAFANISKDIMPTKERESIGMIKPTGWHTIKYDIVSGKYLYNRCHLIAYQLTGENDNKENIITCTRQMNINGMRKFEDEVADYINETGNHVLYRVTPIFENDNMLAKGVQIEALSVEDNGNGIEINVFVYNAQNGININYSTGDSELIKK